MARVLQVLLLPLVCIALAKAEFGFHIPFFHFGLPHLDGPRPYRPDDDRPSSQWLHPVSGSEEHEFPPDNYGYPPHYDPFFHRDVGLPYPQQHPWDEDMRSGEGSNSHSGESSERLQNHPKNEAKPDHKDDFNFKNSQETPKFAPPKDRKTPSHDKDLKHGQNNHPNRHNSGEQAPLKKNDVPKDNGDDNKKVNIKKKKDFLLVGPGNNGNVYLLHQNNPYQNVPISPNTYQPNGNAGYYPYNSGQYNNPAFTTMNQQPPIAGNQVLGEKVINGQPAMNMNPGNQNPGYVTIYSNGHLIKIPGVVVNSASNNIAPVQTMNPIQGTGYGRPNTFPNNMQNVGTQNPGSHVIYYPQPNQGSNTPIVVQLPNCANSCGSGAAVQSPGNGMYNNNNAMYQQSPNVANQPSALPNGVSNGQSMPNEGAMAVAIPSPGPQPGYQNGPYQPAVEMPVNNVVNQPLANQGQGSYAPNLGTGANNQNLSLKPAAGMQANSAPNQSMISTQNEPNQGSVSNNQNLALQPAVEMPVNGYKQPVESDQSPNVYKGDHDGKYNNQNMPLHPPLSGNPKGNNQQQVLNPENKPIANILNQGRPTARVPTPERSQKLKVVLNRKNMASLGPQPAIMISDFKEKAEDRKKIKDKEHEKEKDPRDAKKNVKEKDPKDDKKNVKGKKPKDLIKKEIKDQKKAEEVEKAKIESKITRSFKNIEKKI